MLFAVGGETVCRYYNSFYGNKRFNFFLRGFFFFAEGQPDSFAILGLVGWIERKLQMYMAAAEDYYILADTVY